MNDRTDLAAEAFERSRLSVPGGATCVRHRHEQAQLEIQRIQIFTEQAAEEIGKAVGKYVTIRMTDAPMDSYSAVTELRTRIIADEIKLLCPDPKRILVAGLGNRDITPDAVGPLCADGVFATRHIKRLAREIDTGDLTEMSVIRPGVLGQTGVEASDIVRTVCSAIGADTVIAVDALACSDSQNLGRTIQLTDTGISPGSGVANSRKELSESTLGAACVAVGVPTVTDFSSGGESMMVTPRNVDQLVKSAADYISMAVNLAFQPALSYADLRSLV